MHNIISTISNNPLISTIVSGIIILVISLFISRKKKVLSYKIISNNLLITNSENIKISYSDKEINNIGNDEINPTDYNQNISIIFDEDINVLSAIIKEKSPDNLNINFEIKDNKVLLNKIHLNAKDKFIIQVELTSKNNLIKEKLDKIQVSTHIAGFKIIEKTPIAFLSFLPIIYMTFTLLILVILFFSIKSTLNDLSSSKITTKYIKIPMSTPPDIYIIPVSNSITTIKDFLLEYRKSIMKISEWED